MAAFREAVMLKIALARRRRRNLSFQMATQASTASFMFITAASDAVINKRNVFVVSEGVREMLGGGKWCGQLMTIQDSRKPFA